MTIINSTFVIRFKSGVSRQETASQLATIHSATVIGKAETNHKKKLQFEYLVVYL